MAHEMEDVDLLLGIQQGIAELFRSGFRELQQLHVAGIHQRLQRLVHPLDLQLQIELFQRAWCGIHHENA